MTSVYGTSLSTGSGRDGSDSLGYENGNGFDVTSMKDADGAEPVLNDPDDRFEVLLNQNGQGGDTRCRRDGERVSRG